MKTLILKEFLQKEKVQAILICISLLFLAVIIQTVSHKTMKGLAAETFKPLNSADSIQKEIIHESLRGNIAPNARILMKQYLISENVKNYYKVLGTSYYVNYYSFSICSIVFTTLLTIAVFLMTNKGWQNSNIILKTFLLSNIVLSSIYYFLPNVINNKVNLNSNILKIKSFQILQSNITQTSLKLDSINDKKVDTLISSYFDTISSNIDFPATIDDSKIHEELLDAKKTWNKK